MSILERDRAAAYFADPEYGTQVLICSEIGSEGRNFQFAHHMVLFDLPLNPDLLEQRIGRLDRIGQSETIKLHIPYLQGSAQQVMSDWYHQGLNAFEQTCPAGHSVFVQLRESLVEALHQIDEGIEDLPALITTTKQLHQQLNEQLHNGRDQLLEYNSCRPHVANQLKEMAERQDQHSELFDYLEEVFDCYGVDTEDHGDQSYIIRPSEHMQNQFPGLYEEGMTITCDRATALANEDMHFLTWEHPMVTGAMDMVSSSELGNSAVIAIKHQGIKPGTLMVESLFILQSATRQGNRYLPPTTLRVMMDANGKDYSAKLSHELINQVQQNVDNETAAKVVRAYAQDLREIIADSERAVEQRVPEMLALAHQHSRETLNREINRLKALKQVNPSVREEELAFFENQLEALTKTLESAKLRMDGVRVVVGM
jgi:ATP-dependent helicase HepA